jgi:hypothetical protein
MTDLDSSDAVVAPGALGWLRTVLWGPDVDIAFAAGAEGDVTFLAEPSASAPELLVPSGPAAAVAAVSRRSSDARSLGGRLRTTVVEAVAATGLIPRLAPDRLVSLRLGEGADDPDRSLPAHVAALLGLEDMVFAVTMGAERYNRKPVLTAFDAAGHLVAFVKVGADDLTDRYVMNEERWLTAIADREPTALEVPAVTWSGVWRHHAVLVTTPVRPPRLPARLSVERPPAGLVEAIADVVPGGPVAVSATLVAVSVEAVDDARLVMARHDVLDRHGDTEVRVGLWHGDLSPWNLASRRRRPPLVWDWEAADGGRPVGADLLHSIVMVATHLRGASPAEAVARLTTSDIGDHQLDAAARAAALDLYLLDVARRDLDIVAGGVEADLLPGIGAAALDRLVGRD